VLRGERFCRGVPWMAALLVTSVCPTQSVAQSVRCQLTAGDAGVFVGDCRVGAESARIELSRPSEATDAVWSGSGTTTGATASMEIEIAIYQYSAGPRLIVRTDAWYLLTEHFVSGAGLVLAWDEGVEAPPSQTDLDILSAARAFLVSEDVWDRADDRNCENDESLVSVYCALARATAAAMGRYQHRQPAMQAVRRVIRSEWPERVVDHRLMNFNNDVRTTLSDVERLFDLAEESLRRTVR
jgi:hypothetical protein